MDAQQILKFVYMAWEKEKEGSRHRRNLRVTLAFSMVEILLQNTNCPQALDKKQPRSVLARLDTAPPDKTHCKHT